MTDGSVSRQPSWIDRAWREGEEEPPRSGGGDDMGASPRAWWWRRQQRLQGSPQATTTGFWSLCWLMLGAWRGLLASACPTSCACSPERIWCSEAAASLVSFPVLGKRSEREKVSDM